MSLKYVVQNQSFLTGVGRTLDLGGLMTRYTFVRRPRLSTAEKLGSDFRVIGKDLSIAISKTTSQLDSIARSSKRYSEILREQKRLTEKQRLLEQAMTTLLSAESSSKDVERVLEYVLAHGGSTHSPQGKGNKRLHRKEK
jgi:hypothetical protein